MKKKNGTKFYRKCYYIYQSFLWHDNCVWISNEDYCGNFDHEKTNEENTTYRPLFNSNRIESNRIEIFSVYTNSWSNWFACICFVLFWNHMNMNILPSNPFCCLFSFVFCFALFKKNENKLDIVLSSIFMHFTRTAKLVCISFVFFIDSL